ncbi:MAG: TadE/TadG family type IV pilus assembly protein [Chloroflexota bacterium]
MTFGIRRLRLRRVRRKVYPDVPSAPHASPFLNVSQPASDGQSLVEFALVVPFLLILLLTVADFGRYFAAAISVESIARTAAEVAAQEYVRAGAIDHSTIHGYAWQSVCNEGQTLPNVMYSSPTTECSGIPTLVCVHDGVDPMCSTPYNASGGVPAQCTAITPDPITNAMSGEGAGLVFVEVRVCYRFSTIFGFSIPFVGGSLESLSGDFYIQRTRTFTVANY